LALPQRTFTTKFKELIAMQIPNESEFMGAKEGF
jgi:hypothetical protein